MIDMAVALMTVRDLAEALTIKPSWVYNQVKRNNIPFLRLGRQLRFDYKKVIRRLEQQTEMK